MLESLSSIRLVEIVDLLVVWLLAWAAISWLRSTSARVGLAGLGILLGLYLIAQQLGLTLTTWILQGFAAVAVLIGVVVFQQELRRLFEQLATFWVGGRSFLTGPGTVDVLTRTIASLVDRHWGALIVIPGHQPVEAHIEGGLALDAQLSEPLLLSIFDPHSPGHDGAVVLAGDRVARFAAALPLSTDRLQLGQRGTRHAAGLGLAERTDALSIIISEERGSVSIAELGRFRTLRSPGEVAHAVREFEARLAPDRRRRAPRFAAVLREWRAGALSLLIAGLLWFLAFPGAANVEVERTVRVEVTGIPPDFALESVDPPRVRVLLEGRRRDLLLLPADAVKVRVEAVLVELGRRTFPVTVRDVNHPDDVDVRRVEPDQVKLSLREVSSPGGPSVSEKKTRKAP